MLKFYLKTFGLTSLAYAITGLLFASGKNTDSGNSSPLNLNSINIFGDKFSCWKDLIYLEQDLIVGGKDLKLCENGLNNWWKKNIILAGQSSVLCKRLISSFYVDL